MRWRISLIASLAFLVAASCDRAPIEPEEQVGSVEVPETPSLDAKADHFRPYSDYLVNNPPFQGWFSPDTWYLALITHGAEPKLGILREKALADGTAELTVKVHDDNATLRVVNFLDVLFWTGEPPYPDLVLGAADGWPALLEWFLNPFVVPFPTEVPGAVEYGSVDFQYTATVILPYPGAEIPTILASPDIALKFGMHANGHGMIDVGGIPYGLTPGAPGRVTIAQNFRAALAGNDGYGWPVETVKVQEVGN